MSLRDKIQQAAKRTDAATLVGAVAAVKRGDRSGFIPITGAMIWAGYSCPDAIEAVYDNIATAWLGSGSAPEVPTGLAEAPLEDIFCIPSEDGGFTGRNILGVSFLCSNFDISIRTPCVLSGVVRARITGSS